MINTIQQLKKNHQNFDVIWNKIGTEVQKDLVKTAPELLTALGAWYNRSNELIFELEDQIEENALMSTANVDLGNEENDDTDDIDAFDDLDDDEEENDEEEEDTNLESNDYGDSPRPGISVNIPSGISL
mgnify:CR=1 FL=1